MILIATFGSRSRKARKSSRRSTNSSDGSPAVASAVRLWPSSTATSPNRSPGPMKFSVRRLPSEAPVSIRIWPRRTPYSASPASPFWNSISPSAELLGVAKAGDALQFVGAQIRKHRVHFQNDRKFGLFAHCITFQIGPGPAPSGR